jgi:prophage regulatory protein
MSNDRLLRLAAVMDRTGLAKPSVYRLESEGKFPKRVKLSERCVAWREAEISEWIASRVSPSAAQKLVG